MSIKTNIPFILQTAFLAGIFSTLFLFSLNAQTDCGSKIQEAMELYDQGLIDQIPPLLLPCIEEGFTRPQRIEAYKLLIQTYLLDGDQVEAENTMLEFLKKNPEYEISPNDPAEFVYLFDSYRTTSVFSVGFTAGFSLTDPRIIEPFTALDFNNATLSNTMKSGFNVGIGMAQYISRRMLLNIELNFAQNQYSFSDQLNLQNVDGNNVVNQVNFNEKLYRFDIPVTLVYEFYVRKVHYYLRTGISLAKITGDKGQPSRKFSEELPPISGEYINMRDYRKSVILSAIGGAGIRYKIPRGVISMDVRLNYGLTNIVQADYRYSNPDLLAKYYYVDDDFTLTNISLSAGYYFSFYTPSKQ